MSYHTLARALRGGARWPQKQLFLVLALLLASCATPQAAAPLCTAAGVSIDVAFEGAGQHRCLEAAPGQFVLSVDPESQPINPSPWFAFRIHASAPRHIEVTLQYTNADHRYAPKLSTDGVHWRLLAPEHVTADDDHDTATLTLEAPAGATFIAAQPIETPEQTLRWARQTLRRAGFTEVEYGRSLEGRPLVAFLGGGEGGDGLIVAMTRQHPPETTGAGAFRAFVETLVADTPQMRVLRARHRILLAPMPNPDGVTHGHWRQNAGGVDLNRDWEAFTQPESATLAELITREAQGRRVVAFIDFHSTQRSVVYAPPLDAPSATIGFLPFLEQQLEQSLTAPPAWSYSHNENSGVTKAWALEHLGAPGITFELADTAEADEVQQIGQITAHALASFFAGQAEAEN